MQDNIIKYAGLLPMSTITTTPTIIIIIIIIMKMKNDTVEYDECVHKNCSAAPNSELT